MKYRQIAVAAAMALSASAALAVPVTVVGSTFDITYDNALVGLFGAPMITGNQVAWFPSGSPGFSASAISDVKITNSTFVLQLTAKPGYTLTGFSLLEGGDYKFYGSGSFVAAGGELRATPLTPGGPTLIDDIDITSGAFLPQATSFPFPTRKWLAAATLALPAGTTQANATVENILFVYAADVTPGDYAFIEKKDVFLTVMTAPIPEPETYALMLAGLGVVGFVALRRRKAR